jgi:hypothetical protein
MDCWITVNKRKEDDMKCPICRKEVDLNNLHPDSLPISKEEFTVYHVGCANGEDCTGGGDLSGVDLEDYRAWIKWA